MKAFLLVVPLITGACATAPVATIPPRPPEVDAWEVEARGGAFLGIDGEENDSGSLDALFFDPGVRVARVVRNSPADAAGVRAGDVVLAIDELEVSDPDALLTAAGTLEPGAAVTLRVRRGDTVFDVPVTLVPRGGDVPADARALYHVDPLRSRAGWASVPGGARLAAAAPDSPFARADLAVGDVVVAVDGAPVASARDLVRRLQARDEGARVDVRTADGRTRRVTLQEVPRRVTGVSIPILFNYEAAADGSRTAWAVLDFWLFQILEYERLGSERRWELIELFDVATGVGELAE